MLANTIQSLHITNEQLSRTSVRDARRRLRRIRKKNEKKRKKKEKERKNKTELNYRSQKKKNKKRETLYDLSGLARFILLFLSIMPWHWLSIQFHHYSIASDTTHRKWNKMKNHILCALLVSVRFMLDVFGDLAYRTKWNKVFYSLDISFPRSLSIYARLSAYLDDEKCSSSTFAS